MKIRRLFIEKEAVSSTIGVVLMVAVTVILAAAVGTFALGLAGQSTKKIPSASIETKWGADGGADTLDITMLGGDAVRAEHITVVNSSATIWSDDTGPSGSVTTYDGNTWTNAKIKSGETLGLKETNSNGFNPGDTIEVVWNNGEKSQVLGAGTLS